MRTAARIVGKGWPVSVFSVGKASQKRETLCAPTEYPETAQRL